MRTERKNGYILTYNNNNKLHSFNDKPAINDAFTGDTKEKFENYFIGNF